MQRNQRNFFAKCLALFCLLLLNVALFPHLTYGFERGLRSAILVNLNTGRILYEKNADVPIPPASLTKIMTMYLALDAVKAHRLRLDAKIRIPVQATRVGGSSMHLKAGDVVPLARLLAGMAVASGNDAATAVAFKVGGSTRSFVSQMNAKARRLGLKRTTFKNPTGLPDAAQKTSARDMMQLSQAYLKAHPEAMRFHGMQNFLHRGLPMRNTNTLLGTMNGVNGLKTGWTVASGYNLVVTATRGKTRLLLVVLGASSREQRDNSARCLLEAGFLHPLDPKNVQASLNKKRAVSKATKMHAKNRVASSLTSRR